MVSRLITLKAWAQNMYGEASPCPATLRRWARGSKIYPPAEKHGREYFVVPGARYVAKSECLISVKEHPPIRQEPVENPVTLLTSMINDRKRKKSAEKLSLVDRIILSEKNTKKCR